MKKIVLGVIGAISLAITLTWAVSAYTNGVAQANVTAYEALLATIYGTEDDRSRGEKLLHHRMQHVITTCMTDQGFGYSPPTYAGSSAGVVAPGDLDVGTPLSNSFGIAERYQAHAKGVEATRNSGGNKPGAEAARNPETGKAYSTAMDICIAKAMPLEEDYHPASQKQAVTKLLTELRKTQLHDTAASLLREYQLCLQKAGYQAASRAELFGLIIKQFPNPEQPWSQLSSSKQWQEAAAAEQKAASTDTRCRAKLYYWAAGHMRTTIDHLSTDPQITSVGQGWDAIEAGHKAAGL